MVLDCFSNLEVVFKFCVGFPTVIIMACAIIPMIGSHRKIRVWPATHKFKSCSRPRKAPPDV